MYLATQSLPSGVHYNFESIQINPMTFAQIIEYLENVPKDPLEKFYFDYCLVKTDDPNIENVLLSDLPYIVFMKKAITISEDIKFTVRVKCPRCGQLIPVKFTLAMIQFHKFDEIIRNGLTIKFNNEITDVRVPTMIQFMEVFKKYRLYKKVTDMRLIKLIALFSESERYLQKYENLVINSTHKDITVLSMLEDLYYQVVDPVKTICPNCVKNYKPTEEELELPEDELELIKTKHGGVAVAIDELTANFFRSILENNTLTAAEVLPRTLRQDDESGELQSEVNN